MGRERVHAPILQFAGDTLIFCKYDDDMLDNLCKTIELFEWCSGQKVNWEKSAICGLNIDENKVLSVAVKLNCKVEQLPIMYLGLPLGGYPKKVSFWQPVIDKVQGKLDRWRRYNLPRGGRATLCKLVLSNLPTHYMPGKVVSTLERIMINFFCEGSKGGKLNHLVKWKLFLEPKKMGPRFGRSKKQKLSLVREMGLEIYARR